MRLDLWAASLLLLEHSTKIWWVTYHMPSDSSHCHNGQSESHYVRGSLYIRAALLLYMDNPPCLCKIPIICLRVAYIVIMSCPNLTRWEAHYISKGSSLASPWAALLLHKMNSFHPMYLTYWFLKIITQITIVRSCATLHLKILNEIIS